VGGTSLQARGSSGGGQNSGGGKGSGKLDGGDKEKECYNCHKKGHISKDCWTTGGGREGQGPKGRKGPHRSGRTNQARDNINSTLNDVAYMAYSVANSTQVSKYDWFLDSASTSHICTIREAFTEYHPLTNSTIRGIGTAPAVALGRGTIFVNFDVNRKIITHQLKNVLHVPEAENCFLSLGRFDEGGGHVLFKDKKCTLYGKKGNIVGMGTKQGGLFLLSARAQIGTQERANIAASKNLTWDQWHR